MYEQVFSNNKSCALLISFLSVSFTVSQNLKSLNFEILTRQLCQLVSDNAQKQPPEVFYEEKCS